MKRWISVLLSVLLLLGLTGMTTLAADENKKNGLKTLEYRINESEWQTVPDFTENGTGNSFSVELLRSAQIHNAVVEIRATPMDPENKVVSKTLKKVLNEHLFSVCYLFADFSARCLRSSFGSAMRGR